MLAWRWCRPLSAAAVGLLTFVALGVQAYAGLGGTAPALAQTALQVSAGGPYGGTAGVPVTFGGAQTFSQSPVFTWSFGDGTIGNGQIVSHTYTSGGVFSVTLNVTDQVTGQSVTSGTTAAIASSSTCALGTNVTFGTVCSFNAGCLPGVTVPVGTFCSAGAGCFPGVTLSLGTICSSGAGCFPGVTVPFGTICSTGFSCVPGLPTVLGTACSTGVNCVTGLGVACQSGVGCNIGTFCLSGSFSPVALGCTPGTPPCGVGVTCVPVAFNQVICSNVASTPAIVPAPASVAPASAPTPTASAPVTAPVPGNCSLYDSACAYCQEHPTSSVCLPPGS